MLIHKEGDQLPLSHPTWRYGAPVPLCPPQPGPHLRTFMASSLSGRKKL